MTPTDDRHRLVGIGSCTKGIVREITKGEPAVIGRQADCAVAISRASDGGAGPISRYHAVVEHTPDAGWRICDSSSTNGTALLRQGIPPTVRLQPAQWYPLESGDVLELAGSPDYQFVFQTLPGRSSAGAGGTPESVTAAGAAGYVVSHQQNDAFIAVNRLLKTGADVYSLRDSFYVGAGAGTMP